MTIVEAIRKVMGLVPNPMSAREAYDKIVENKLYHFQAKDPQHVVLMQIRRHCIDLDFPTASTVKHFKMYGDNKYLPLPEPIKIVNDGGKGGGKRVPRSKGRKSTELGQLAGIERGLWSMHRKYLTSFKQKMLQELKKMHPVAFEAFGRELLDAYGFENTMVTAQSKDGGIDGYGRLKVGLAHINVAFQCKRWKNTTIQRPEIDRFRGAAQGAYEQGIFFTTSSFSSGAIAASIKPGAIPIVLIDGNSIVELMIQKRLRVESTSMEIPAFAL